MGISACSHDSAAALIQDGAITATAQEERFSRKKQILVIPVSSLMKKPLSDPVYIIPYDGHPSAQCWKEAASELWKILSADPPKGSSAKDGTGKTRSDPGRRHDVIHASGKLEP